MVIPLRDAHHLCTLLFLLLESLILDDFLKVFHILILLHFLRKSSDYDIDHTQQILLDVVEQTVYLLELSAR